MMSVLSTGQCRHGSASSTEKTMYGERLYSLSKFSAHYEEAVPMGHWRFDKSLLSIILLFRFIKKTLYYILIYVELCLKILSKSSH